MKPAATPSGRAGLRYHFSEADLERCLSALRRARRNEGVFFATMISEQAKKHFDSSVPAGNGLRRIDVHGTRVGHHDPYMCCIWGEST